MLFLFPTSGVALLEGVRLSAEIFDFVVGPVGQLLIEAEFVFGDFGLDGAIDFGEGVEGALANGVVEAVGIDDLQVFQDLFLHCIITVW